MEIKMNFTRWFVVIFLTLAMAKAAVQDYFMMIVCLALAAFVAKLGNDMDELDEGFKVED